MKLPRLTTVDALRGFAALLVVVHHTHRDSGLLVMLKPVAEFGWSGVGLFLVLSGFSIHLRWAASQVPHHEFTRRRFFTRRFFRLYPTYLAIAVIAVPLAAVLRGIKPSPVPWLFVHHAMAWWVLIPLTVLAPTANIIASYAIVWSLGLEIQLYVVYAFIIGKLRRIGIMKIVVGTLVIALAWRVGSEFFVRSVPVARVVAHDHNQDLAWLMYRQLPSRAFEWFLGVLAAEAYVGRVTLPRWTRSPAAGIAVILAAAVLFREPLGLLSVSGHAFRLTDVVLDPVIGLGYFMLLLAVVTREEALRSRVIAWKGFLAFAWVGGFSYTLYLLHPFLLYVSRRYGHTLGLSGNLETVLMWAFVLTSAWAFSQVFEQPFITGAGDRWVTARVRALLGLQDRSRVAQTPDGTVSIGDL